MNNIIVNLAYKIESSKLHKSFRNFLHNTLINNSSNYKKVFDLSMIFLVISTVGILIYEVKHTLPPYIDYFEYFAVGIFILEWLGRLTVSFESHKQIINDYEESQFLNIKYKLYDSIKIITNKKLEYIFSLSSIIDLLAILPSYRPLRILRIFLLFRLFKVLKYSSSLNIFTKVFIEKKLELTLLLLLYLLVIFFSATIIYIYEGNGLNPKIDTFIDAIYWSFITVSTIGYGDITPISDAGRAATIILILAGYTVIAFFTSIVTSSIGEKLDSIKQTNTLSNIKKLKNYILVCGYGKTAQVLIDNLKDNNYNFLIIENNPAIIAQYHSAKINIIKGDATDISLLKKIGINKNISKVIILTSDDTVNLSIILSVRSLNTKIHITCRSNRVKIKEKLLIAGANRLIELNDLASHVALGYLNAPVAYEAIDDILVDYKGAIMSEIEIFENSDFINKTLDSIEFKNFNINFIGIVHKNDKENFIFNPNKKNTIISEKDYLIVIGYEKTINEFKTYVQSHKIIS